jgi:hypothetical protein
MKYIKTFERYKFIELLELQDRENEIELIEKTFEELNVLDTFDCLVDLEELIPNFGIGHLSPYLLRSGIGFQNLRCLGQSTEAKFLRTEDYFTEKSSIHGNNSYGMHIMTSLIGLSMQHQKIQWQMAFDDPSVSTYFKDKIKEETGEFSNLLSQGWMPCFVIHQKLNINVSSDDKAISIISDIKNKLEGLLDKTIIFLPPKNEFSFLIIDKKFLN